MTEQKVFTREYLNLENLLELNIQSLFQHYQRLLPDATWDGFLDEIVSPVAQDESAGGDDLLAEIRLVRGMSIPLDVALSISCAYSVQAKRAIQENNRDLAWSYLSDARYWCGALYADVGKVDGTYDQRAITDRADFIVLKEQLKANTKSELASSGGKARAKNREPLIEEAYRLARTKQPSKGWPSRRNAAKVITPEVIDLGIKIGKPLSVDEAQDTIYGWLSKMPDAAALFPSRPKASKK